MNIHPNGSWTCDTIEPHTFDSGLFNNISEFCIVNEIETAIDIGCGSGKYVEHLNRIGVIYDRDRPPGGIESMKPDDAWYIQQISLEETKKLRDCGFIE